MFRQFALAASGGPTQVCNGRTDPTAYECFERRPVLHGDDPVQKGKGLEQHSPHVLVPLRGESGCQLKIVREGHEACDGGGPGVVDEIEPLGGGESIDAGVQYPIEQLRRIAHAVETMAFLVDQY